MCEAQGGRRDDRALCSPEDSGQLPRLPRGSRELKGLGGAFEVAGREKGRPVPGRAHCVCKTQFWNSRGGDGAEGVCWQREGRDLG